MSKRAKEDSVEESEEEDSKQKEEASGSAEGSESEEEESPKKKAPAKKRTRKPPKKKARTSKGPKKPTTAYVYYCKLKRDEFQEKYKDMKYAELRRKMSEVWKDLPQDKRKEFNDLCEKDKKRYQDEMKKFSPSSESDESSENKKKKKRKSKGKKRAKKDPNKPKQATNAYMYFQKDQRESIKLKFPELKTLPLMAKKMGETWKKND